MPTRIVEIRFQDTTQLVELNEKEAAQFVSAPREALWHACRRLDIIPLEMSHADWREVYGASTWRYVGAHVPGGNVAPCSDVSEGDDSCD